MTDMVMVKRDYTTGEIARICHVAPRTVSKWVDGNLLSGRRLPGSKDRRVNHLDLVSFMRKHGMPLDGFIGLTTRILAVPPDDLFCVLQKTFIDTGSYEVETVQDVTYEFGYKVGTFNPHVVLMDGNSEACLKIAGLMRFHPDMKSIQRIGYIASLKDEQSIPEGTFHTCLSLPLTTTDLVAAVEYLLKKHE